MTQGVESAPNAGSLDRRSPAADGPEGPAPEQPIRITALQGWHLPLLDDPSFLPLLPLLQKALLLAVPRRLLSALAQQPAQRSPLVLVACGSDRRGRSRALGLLLARPHNRSGSCMELQQLLLASSLAEDPSLSTRPIAVALLREAIDRARSAASWIATASSLDSGRLAILRELGFQPQRTERIYRWQPPAGPASPPLPASLQLRPLQSRSAALLWHLEQATCPAPLRQLLDRRVEDLLDRSEGRGWLLIDSDRNEAVAAARWVADHPAGGARIELSVHPGWSHLLGAPTELLLRRLTPGDQPLWLHSEVGDRERQAWLQQLGALEQGDEVLMARTVWRRQEGTVSLRAAQRLGAVLEQLQPGRRPVPTPLLRR
ncbi:MAG: hypothetical protein VKN15_06975 [Cyanobacteriota bacterium]|nr:hypothetical protein [Cyanobacteriota bacterium]